MEDLSHYISKQADAEAREGAAALQSALERCGEPDVVTSFQDMERELIDCTAEQGDLRRVLAHPLAELRAHLSGAVSGGEKAERQRSFLRDKAAQYRLTLEALALDLAREEAELRAALADCKFAREDDALMDDLVEATPRSDSARCNLEPLAGPDEVDAAPASARTPRSPRGARLPPELEAVLVGDAELRRQAEDELSACDTRFRTQLRLLRERFQDTIALAHGGWTEEEAFHFAKLLSEYPKSEARWRMAFYERLTLEMPEFAREELLEHEAWLSRSRHYQAMQKAMRRMFQRARGELVEHLRVAFEAAHDLAKRAGRKQYEAAELRKVRQRLHSQLEAWRAVRDEEDKREMERAERARAEEEAAEREAAEKIRRMRERTKQQIDAHRARVADQQRVADEQRRIEEAAAAEEHAAQAVINQQRVLYRAEEFERKMDDLASLRAQREQADAEREARLDRLRQTVAVDVPDDPMRLLEPTVASQMYAEENRHRMPGPGPFKPVHGFTVEEVLADGRVKLDLVLREAGLHRSDYAAAAIARAKPASVPRPDQQSEHQEHARAIASVVRDVR